MLAAAATLATARGAPLLAAQLWAALERQTRTQPVSAGWLVPRLREQWLPQHAPPSTPTRGMQHGRKGPRYAPNRRSTSQQGPSPRAPG